MRPINTIIFAILLGCGTLSCQPSIKGDREHVHTPPHPQATADNQATGNADNASAAGHAGVHVERVTFRGWANVWKISNDACQLIIAPQIGRVLSFRLTGMDNVLWINDALAGKTAPVDDVEWRNFGGEKVWPTEQSLWPKLAGRAWAPPYPYDGGAAESEAIPGGVRMTTAVDPHFGAQVVREFTLDPKLPVVYIRQHHRKVKGPPVPMTLWSICQVNAPIRAMSPASIINGEHPFVPIQTPLAVKVEGGVVTIRNDKASDQKIGFHADPEKQNGWVGAIFPDGQMIVMSHEVVAGGAYPDGGCDREIYAGRLEAKGTYLELELLSPLRMREAGQDLYDNTVWTLVKLDGVEGAGVRGTDLDRAEKAASEAHARALAAIQAMAAK